MNDYFIKILAKQWQHDILQEVRRHQLIKLRPAAEKSAHNKYGMKRNVAVGIKRVWQIPKLNRLISHRIHDR